jgi:hypothetical protein
MCRNIHVLHNFDPPATSDEVMAAALQYVRKVSGTTKPSKANQEAFDEAVHDIAHATQHLLEHLTSSAPPKDRETEAAKAKALGARFATARRRAPDRVRHSGPPTSRWSHQSQHSPERSRSHQSRAWPRTGDWRCNVLPAIIA